VALALANLGGLATARGAYAAAHQRLSASLVIQQDLADTAGAAFVLERLAALAAAQGRHASALRLAGAAAALRRAAGAPLSPVGQAKLDATLAPARRAAPETAATDARPSGEAPSLGEAVAEALSVAWSEPAAGAPDGAAGLTPREREVAGLIAQGRTNRQIAEALVITQGTAANHVVHILNKLGFSSRTRIAAWAVAQGLADGQERAER
jgi:DNA-binding CsgD family transcriptional regulator